MKTRGASTYIPLDIEKDLVTSLVHSYLEIEFLKIPESAESAGDRQEILSELGKLQKLMGGRHEQGEWGPYQKAVSQAILSFEHACEGNAPEGYPSVLFDPSPSIN